jgi:ribA/ribD-fused uncharacterized protein
VQPADTASFNRHRDTLGCLRSGELADDIQEGLMMNWVDPSGRVQEDCAVLFRVREEFGEFSNMAGGYPLEVMGMTVPSSEALYQAMRFTEHPEIQREILDQSSPMAAKMVSKRDRRRDRLTRRDWPEIRVDVMRWSLRIKWTQHIDSLFSTMMSTRQRAIVERSRKDRFWGAVLEDDHQLHGENRLGCLLMELREELRQWLAASDDDEPMPSINPPKIHEFLLLGTPIGTVW